MDQEALKRAKRYATHKYNAVREELARDYQEKMVQDRAELGRRGLANSGPMAAAVARNSIELAKREIQARADALIDGFELHGIPLDEEAEEEILKDVQDLRTTIVAARKRSAPVIANMPHGMSNHFAEQMETISVPWNALKAQIEERRYRPRMAPIPAPA